MTAISLLDRNVGVNGLRRLFPELWLKADWGKAR